MTQIKLDNGRVFAFSDDVIERPGATETVTTDTEVAIPASRNVAQPNAAQIQQQKQIRDQESQIK